MGLILRGGRDICLRQMGLILRGGVDICLRQMGLILRGGEEVGLSDRIEAQESHGEVSASVGNGS